MNNLKKRMEKVINGRDMSRQMGPFYENPCR